MSSLLIGITLLLTAAWGAASMLRHRSAALRHAVWTCAIAGTLLFAPLRWRAPRRVISRPLPAILTPAVTVAATSQADPGFSPGGIAIAIWLLGSTFVALRLFLSAAQFRRIARGAKPLASASPVPILTSPRLPGPLVMGVFRPAILLPESASTWTASRRRAVLAHELSHIRRRDPVILLTGHLATIVYWFHPLCWLAAARLRLESERACDDAALRIGVRPSHYAGHLLDLARLFNPQPAIPMATTSHLESRVKSILDPLVNRSFAARRTWLAAAVITAAFVAPMTVFNLRAQSPRSPGGHISGTVTDPTGAVVPRVQLIATNSAGRNRELATSDSAG
ncbi:MAG TPA: M56 family metallopeptidase, partial [Bryobacteraceae bacterium]|nr:M56 family metallopeptidase [Bryobacteraceae bacterium]